MEYLIVRYLFQSQVTSVPYSHPSVPIVGDTDSAPLGRVLHPAVVSLFATLVSKDIALSAHDCVTGEYRRACDDVDGSCRVSVRLFGAAVVNS